MPLLLPIGQFDAGPRPARALAPVTASIAVVCLGVFAGPQDFGQAGAWAGVHGLTPARYFGSAGLGWVASPLTSIITHASWTHLVFNLIALLVFGSAVERKVGARWFGFLFFGLGGLALLAEAVSAPSSTSPIVGASGGVAAIAGAFAAAFPRSRILVAALFLTLPVRAWVAIGLWLAFEVGMWVSAPASSTTAHAAHLAGFALGLTVMAVFLKNRPQQPARGIPRSLGISED